MSLSAEKNAVEFFIWRLKSQIAKLKLRPHPGGLSGPSDWLKLCEALLSTAVGYLTAASDAKTKPDKAVQFLREANKLCNDVYKNLVEMEGSGTDALPYAIVAPMQRWVDDLKIKNVIFFRSLAVANYELRQFQRASYEGIRSPSDNLQLILDQKEKWPYLRITVPGKALSILPHFAIVAHEIGHILYDQAPQNFTIKTSDYTKFQEKVLKKLGQPRLNENDRLFLNAAVRFWGTELFADAIGICMLGPAFFFALCAFMESLGRGNIISKTHPSAVIRRRIAFQKLNRSPKYSFHTSFRKATGVALTERINSNLLNAPQKSDEAIIRTLKGSFSNEEAVILAYLPSLIETIGDQVYDKAEQKIRSLKADLLYTSSRLEADLAEHLENLVNAVPPIESGRLIPEKKPAELVTILNVGWAVLLTRLDRLAVPKEGVELLNAERSEKLHSLLIKAVELSEARKKWITP
ncbi:hypothetical protein QRQ56_15300 [Bradyrhizobium sp. U531]|uniref:hypothetical protein n=1 Tax=Bradyrhizobium sp. U531 TaxID=3053458 RepID=UPI003F437EB6